MGVLKILNCATPRLDEDANGGEWLMGYAEHEKFHHKQMDEMIERVRELK